MHPNSIFRQTSNEKVYGFVAERSFGALCINAKHGPLVSHIPLQFGSKKSFVEAHLVRSNPILRELKEPQPAVITVTGPDAYISPDWYGMGNQQVPTWNYVSVHLRGTLRRLDDSELFGILDRLSQAMEARLKPKAPWKIGKMTDETYAKMSKQVVPIGFDVKDVQSTWKLSQNKTERSILGAAEGVANGALGIETGELAALMREALRD